MAKRKRKQVDWNVKLKRLIVCALRKIFFYSPLRKECIEKAKVGELYLCGITGKKHPINCVTVDHIIPVIDPQKGFVDWNTYIERLFCPVENLQCISKEQHAKKTKEEGKKRREAKKRVV